MIRRLALVILFFLSLFLSWKLAFVGTHERTTRYICELVDRHYYKRDDPVVREWLTDCRQYREKLSNFKDRDQYLKRINGFLELLQVSHLFVYKPEENLQLWANEGVDTGIRARQIEDALVVYKVASGSSSEQAGVRVGDKLVTLNGQPLRSAPLATTSSGEFEVERLGKKLSFSIKAVSLSENLGPRYKPLFANQAVLELASFLPQYFEAESWKALLKAVSSYSHLIVDLRGNSGGSFPAMLRALSSFECNQRVVGTLIQSPHDKEIDSEDLKDELAAESQLEQLARTRRVHLRTFPDYGCYQGKLTILIDYDTSSVAEIFAQALWSRPKTRVWGTVSAGQVVMAQWFDLSMLGPDFSISIPVAGYVTSQGEEIESTGLQPSKHLQYELQEALRGKDSWILRASE